MVVVQVMAIPLLVQPQSSASDNAANWIRRTARILDSRDLGDAAVAPALVSAPHAMAGVRFVKDLAEEGHSDAVGAAMQGAVIPDSAIDEPPNLPTAGMQPARLLQSGTDRCGVEQSAHAPFNTRRPL